MTYLLLEEYVCYEKVHFSRAKVSDQLDGNIVIFDIETNGVARKLCGHTRQIQSLRSVTVTILTNIDSQ